MAYHPTASSKPTASPSTNKPLETPFLCAMVGPLKKRPSKCACGSSLTVEHALSCAKGGFPSIRHNEIRDLTAGLLSEVCNNVCTEPELLPVTGENLAGASANTQPGA